MPTPILALPYPAASDPADVPADIKKLADRIEALLATPLAYQEFTANVPVAATAELAATTVVTAPAVTTDGSPIVVEFYAAFVVPAAVVGAYIYFFLYDGATSQGLLAGVMNPSAAANSGTPVFLQRRLTPSAGSHTYSMRAAGAGTPVGNVYAGVGGAGIWNPGFIRVRRA